MRLLTSFKSVNTYLLMQTKLSMYNGNDKETGQEQEHENLMTQETEKEKAKANAKELERIREQERLMEKERLIESETEREREKERMRKKEREMEKEIAREKEKEKERVKEREKEKERIKEMELERDKEKTIVKEMELERNKEKERVKEMELEWEKDNILPMAENSRLSDNVFANVKKYSHEEYQYINLIHDILDNGRWEEGRNGQTKSVFGNSMRFTLKNGQIPIFTTKKTAWKTCLKELLWFIRGDTDVRKLQKQGVHIWDGNSSREFLNSRGLIKYPEGIIGPC